MPFTHPLGSLFCRRSFCASPRAGCSRARLPAPLQLTRPPAHRPPGPKVEGLADYFVKEYADISGRAIVKAMSLSLQKKARLGCRISGFVV